MRRISAGARTMRRSPCLQTGSAPNLRRNDRLYNVEATNNVHVGGKRVRGFMGIEVVNPAAVLKMKNRTSKLPYTPYTLYGCF